MSHELVIGQDGNALAAFFREPAWHKLGVKFDHEVTDYNEMLKLAGMANLDITFAEVQVKGAANAAFVKPAIAVVLNQGGKKTILGIVGKRYEIIPMETAFSFLQSLQDGARWETAGLIKGGTIGFGSIALEREIVLDPNGVSDVTKNHLLVWNSFDGSTNVAGGRTAIRVVCNNTLTAAMGNIDWKFSIRHTKNAEERAKAVSELWRDEHVYIDEFERQAQAFFQTPVTDTQYQELVLAEYPRPEEDKKGAFTKHDAAVERYTQPWKTDANAGIRGTAWGAWQALTEGWQWGGKPQDTDNGTENFILKGGVWDGPSIAFRQRTFDRVSALVNA